jgi:hypothetical protein
MQVFLVDEPEIKSLLVERTGNSEKIFGPRSPLEKFGLAKSAIGQRMGSICGARRLPLPPHNPWTQ